MSVQPLPAHLPAQFSDQLLEALQATFGKHAGHRMTHAKGVVAHGSFTAAPGAAQWSRAAHLEGRAVPVTLRFSNFSGIPQTADAAPSATPRGLGIRFHAAAGPLAPAVTDIVAHSFDGFPVAAPGDFLAFLQAIAASVAEQHPDPAPLAAFLAQHPGAQRYLEAAPSAPASYASIPYFGVNAFGLLAADGRLTMGRYRIDPAAPLPAVPLEQAAALAPDYLAQELASRLADGPAVMRLMFQLAAPGDDCADGSIAWPHAGPAARREILLGELRIDTLARDQQQAAGALALDPGRLADGLALSGDPMVPLRSAVYRLAACRRR